MTSCFTSTVKRLFCNKKKRKKRNLFKKFKGKKGNAQSNLFEDVYKRQVVKDLSRFGRDYIETGRYIEEIFPFMGVRFIALTDNYDSMAERSASDDIVLPFKNLVNDSYARDISIKVRSSKALKRKNGEFVGPFAVYGYAKSPENKNQLIIDEVAAENVRLIFDWKLEGMSAQAIACRLNDEGVLSPMEYKRSKMCIRDRRYCTLAKIIGEIIGSWACSMRSHFSGGR